ncbi:anti-sigma factor antagonist [Mycobacterium sp.]|uniref:anti-sigma factor antagonist n=1 Tax=Mycobacterium sp. TaxID=1785 RepID=UPI0025E31181|nr:anti-sigma factor antagonist [Mycobacterium sp.]
MTSSHSTFEPLSEARATDRRGRPTSLQADIQRVGSAFVVHAVGELDSSNFDAWRTLLATTAAATNAPGPLVIDIRDMSFVATGALLAVAQQAAGCRRRGIDVRLVSDQAITAKLAQLTDLREAVTLYPTVDAALTVPAELLRRLRIHPEHRVSFINAPAQLVSLFLGTEQVDPERADVVLGFVTRRRHLGLLGAAYTAARDGRLAWVVYPKPGQLGSELYRDQMARAVLRHHVQSIAHVSLGDIWSGLLLEPMNDHPAIVTAELARAWPVRPTDISERRRTTG